MIYKPWIHGLTPQQQTRYQPVTYFNYWPVLGSVSNSNIITFSYKSTTGEAFEDIYQVFLDGISENMNSLVRCDNYGAINTTNTSTMEYYSIKLVSEEYSLQYDTICNGKIFQLVN